MTATESHGPFVEDGTLDTSAPSPNKDHHDSVTTYRHAVCDDCGRAIHAHDKQRVYHGNGRYSYNYECPTDGGDD